MFTVAPIPNATKATDMRRHVRPPDCEVNERHATSRTLSSICVLPVTFPAITAPGIAVLSRHAQQTSAISSARQLVFYEARNVEDPEN
jgi:small neutral amino acid transporter SnatA (MarC family)